MVIKSHIDDPPSDTTDGEHSGTPRMPLVHIEDLVGRTFLVPKSDGQVHRARIVKAVEDHEHAAANNPTGLKFKCSMNDDSYEDVLSYNQIMEYLEKDGDNPVVWKFKRIVQHIGPLSPSEEQYKGSSYNVQVEWENGEITDEPLCIIAADDPVTCAIYARDNNLPETPGWKRFCGIARHQKKLF